MIEVCRVIKWRFDPQIDALSFKAKRLSPPVRMFVKVQRSESVVSTVLVDKRGIKVVSGQDHRTDLGAEYAYIEPAMIWQQETTKKNGNGLTEIFHPRPRERQE